MSDVAELQRRLDDARAELEWARALTVPVAGHWVTSSDGYLWERHAVRGYDTRFLPEAHTVGVDLGTYGHPCLEAVVAQVRQGPCPTLRDGRGGGRHGPVFYWKANGTLRQFRQGTAPTVDVALQRADTALLDLGAGYLRQAPTCDCGEGDCTGPALPHKRDCTLAVLGLA